jgi:hypothetical protein
LATTAIQEQEDGNKESKRISRQTYQDINGEVYGDVGVQLNGNGCQCREESHDQEYWQVNGRHQSTGDGPTRIVKRLEWL